MARLSSGSPKASRIATTVKKTAVLINPHSAGGRTLALWPKMRAQLEADGQLITSHTSASEADFRTQTSQFAKKFRSIAICGGDSSLTIAAEELAAVKYTGELRFLPAGSVNDIVLDIREQSREKRRAVYLGQIMAGNAHKTFIGQANWGLGVVVNLWVGKTLQTLPILRPLQNFIGTLSIILAHLLRRECVRLTIHADAQQRSGIFSVVLVSQIRHWASGLVFAPEASYLKPEFQVVTIRRCGLTRLIKIILAAKNGGHLRFPEVESYLAREIEIFSEKAIGVQIDGDILRDRGKEIQHRSFVLKKKKSALSLTL